MTSTSFGANSLRRMATGRMNQELVAQGADGDLPDDRQLAVGGQALHVGGRDRGVVDDHAGRLDARSTGRQRRRRRSMPPPAWPARRRRRAVQPVLSAIAAEICRPRGGAPLIGSLVAAAAPAARASAQQLVDPGSGWVGDDAARRPSVRGSAAGSWPVVLGVYGTDPPAEEPGRRGRWWRSCRASRWPGPVTLASGAATP